MKTAMLSLAWWQWLATPGLFAAAWLLARPLTALTRALLVRIAARTPGKSDDELVPRLAGPISLAWTLGVAVLLLPWLALEPEALALVTTVLRALGLFTFFWALWRTVDSLGRTGSLASWVTHSSSTRSLLLLGVRAGKVVVFAVGAVTVLSQLGYPVVGLVAGLGVGGLAVALAAQKTVENLFGSVSLAVDQPFQIGDVVSVDNFTGTVESVGLRSTRFRTADRTIVTIPNGKLADMKIETLSARDRMRLAVIVGLVYGTTHEQMREVLAGFERALHAQPKLWPQGIAVRLTELATSSVNVEVSAWFDTTDVTEFQHLREEVLLEMLKVVERAGTSFAFPPRPAPTPAPA
jgi:MscS family membrane protein